MKRVILLGLPSRKRIIDFAFFRLAGFVLGYRVFWEKNGSNILEIVKCVEINGYRSCQKIIKTPLLKQKWGNQGKMGISNPKWGNE